MAKKVKMVFKSVYCFFEDIGYSKAIREMNRHGLYKEAKNLMQHRKDRYDRPF